MGQGKTRWLAFAVILSAAFYHPLSLIAANAWEISSTVKPILFGTLTAVVALLLLVPLARATGKLLAAAAIVATLVLIVMNWRTIDSPLLITGIFIGFVVLVLRSGSTAQRITAYVMVAFFGFGSLANVVIQHVATSKTYPFVASTPSDDVQPTGLVEDFLFVVVDQYPRLELAERWFGHDTSKLRRNLESVDFEIVDGWSSNTFTVLAIPSMLELRQVGVPGRVDYGNAGSLMNVMRGESLTSNSLRNAGFTYHHIEGGWDADTCVHVDKCYESPFWDEMMFKLFEHSLFGSWLTETKGTYMREGTFNTLNALLSLQSEIDDGTRDFIYGHLMLPHDPYIVDENCNLLPSSDAVDMIADQLSCVDGMIAQIANMAGDATAVLITGDHGTNSLDQRNKPAEVWTDEQIRERLGVFLAYRSPDGCPSPSSPTTLEVMRMLVSCAVNIELPADHGNFMIGAAADSAWVDADRMAQIMAQVELGTLAP